MIEDSNGEELFDENENVVGHTEEELIPLLEKNQNLNPICPTFQPHTLKKSFRTK